ncbi:MAG: U32 family peptidase [Eubacteriales bacterium]
MMKPELLSPAGDMEKLQAALLYGADAVYLAGEAFGMRAAADNFSLPELREALAYAHRLGKKVYLTVNTMPREFEYPALRAYLSALRESPPDALIVADVGVLALAREVLPGVPLHISTQANTVSAAACLAWRALGATRVVLARELTLEEIRHIRASLPPDFELEVFVHGSMCVSYSGRCLLSGHLTGRDANRGICAQPCRWQYRLRGELVEEKRPGAPLPIEEADGETFILSSKDLCMIEYIDQLAAAGITCFKIEGRAKSAYYTAIITNTYRLAIDAWAAGNFAVNPLWLAELESVAHRTYGTGYFFAEARTEPNLTESTGYIGEKAYVATVLSYDSGTREALCLQRNKFFAGDTLAYLTPGRLSRPFVAERLFDEAHQPIDSTPHPAMRFFIALPFAAQPGDIIRAVR